MKNVKKYTNKEINNIVKNNISPVTIINLDDNKCGKEKFKQIKIKNRYIPYLVSSYGRLFSINYKHKENNCVQLKTAIDKDGYERVNIHYNNKSYGFNVHRIVALSFIRNDDPIKKIQVNHKDGNKLFNNVCNLEWVTPKENINHAWKNNLAISYGEENGNNVYKKKDIIKVCSLIEKDYSFKEINKITGVSYAMISLIYHKKFWTCISNDYDFSNYNYGHTIKNQNIIKICELLQNTDESIISIAKKCSVKRNVIYDILRGHSYYSISRNYDFSSRKNDL